MNLDKRYADPAPYPPIQVTGPNASYAKEMLYNIGSCHSELTSVNLYFYDSLVTRAQAPDVSECFRRIAMVEMHHLDIFGQLSVLLGADPRPWSCCGRRLAYWTPGCNEYPRALPLIIQYALEGENRAVEQYRQQTCKIRDPHIVALLERIILDEKKHIELFHQMLQQL